MCDLIRDVITCNAGSYHTGKINVCDKIMIEKKTEKKKIWKSKFFYINLHRKDRLRVEFTAC